MNEQMILRDVVELSEQERRLIGQAITQHGDSKHPAPSLETIGLYSAAYASECLVRAREAGAGYPDKLAALGKRLLAAVKARPEA